MFVLLSSSYSAVSSSGSRVGSSGAVGYDAVGNRAINYSSSGVAVGSSSSFSSFVTARSERDSSESYEHEN